MTNETRLREIVKDRYPTDAELAELVGNALAELAALRAENSDLQSQLSASRDHHEFYRQKCSDYMGNEIKLHESIAALRARCEGLEAATKEVVVAHRVAKKIFNCERFDPIAHSLATSFLDQKLSALAALREAPRD